MIISTNAQSPDAARLMSPGSLAFLGDAVYSLFVRERLVSAGTPAGQAHSRCTAYVSASAQSRAADIIRAQLTQEESDILRRGRNAHTHPAPKGTTPAQYHASTGFEALFGYLYLTGRGERMRELFELIWDNQE